jgi:RHS repeat-associated protein
MNRITFFIFLLLLSALTGEETPSPLAHFEGGLPCIAGGYVNVLSGAPSLSDTDLVIPGIEPLTLSRRCHYEPNSWDSDKTVNSWDISLIQSVIKGSKFLYESINSHGAKIGIYNEIYSLQEDTQPSFTFEFYHRDPATKAFFNRFEYGKGVTNLSHGYPSGRVAPKNIVLQKSVSGYKADVVKGDGEKMEFMIEPYEYWANPNTLPLRRTITPNGFEKKYTYENGSLKTVSLNTPKGATLGSLSLDKQETYSGYQVRVTATDGRSAQLEYWHDIHKREANRAIIQRVTRTDAPTVAYRYHPSDKNKQLIEVIYPNKRGVGFTYWEDGDTWLGNRKLSNHSYQIYKVKSILQPVGSTAEKIPTHFFEYFTDKKKDWKLAHTKVTTSYGHVDDYFFGDDFLLKELYHYTNASLKLKPTCDQREKFFWYPGGDIKTWALCDGSGSPYSIRHYTYDENGNVLVEATYGALTGNSTTSPEMDENGDPQGKSERFTKKFSYSNDDLNLLLSEESPEGLKTSYSYFEGSDRLKKKVTLLNDKVIKKEFFEYDEDHCLVSYEEKSGQIHLIERHTPSKKTPFGYPLEKRIYTIDSEGEKLLLSHHYRYNSKGEILHESKKDPNGNVLYSVHRKFDPHGNCTYVKDALGYETLRTYDANDNCIREEGPRPGLVKEFHYDFMNRCTHEKLSFEGDTWVTHHLYNQLNQRIETEDPFGHVTKFVYDRYGRALETHLPTGAVIRKKFDASGNEIETTDPLGNITRKKYTILNKPYEISYPDGSAEQFRYYKDGNLKSSTDKNGLATSYERDGLGRILTKKVEDGVETYEYNHSLLKQFTNFNGVTTFYTYDSAGRKISEITDGAKTTFEYDALGRLTRTSYFDRNSLVSTHVEVFDAADGIVKKWIEDGEGNRVLFEKYSYDASGNRNSETKGGHTTTFQYDGLNRLIKKTDPEGNETHWTYSKKGRKETRTDPNGVKTIQVFDGGERLLSKEKYDGKTLLSSISYQYDLNNNLLEEKHQVIGREAPPFILHREYDAMNRLIRLIEPGRESSFTYTPLGQLKTTTKPDGTLLTYLYDSTGNLISLYSQDRSIDYIYTYDLMGHVLSIEGGNTKVVRTYTPRGSVQKEITLGDTYLYEYDDLERVTKVTFPDQSTIEYLYNAIGMCRVKRKGYEHAYLEFDRFGNPTIEQLIDGTPRHKSYDSLNRLQRIAHRDFSLEPLIYDSVGNLVRVGSSIFTYDKLNQLSSESNLFNHNYAFDSIHNPSQKDKAAFKINELNQIDAHSDSHYTYDANGNLLTKSTPEGNWTYRYDHLDRLISVNDSFRYIYDGLHRRVLKKTPSGEERYWHVGDNEVASISESSTIFRALGIGIGAEIGSAILIEFNGEILTPHHDQSGNLVNLGDKSCVYSAFGESSNNLPIPWGFSSKRLDPETGFYYFGRRYYDPSLMRWTSSDPLSFSTGINLYAYVSNNPLNRFDKFGLATDSQSRSLLHPLIYLPGLLTSDFSALPAISHNHQFEQNYVGYPPSQILASDGLPKLPSDLGIGFINGINNDSAAVCQSREYLSKLTGGYSVDTVFNATHGIFGDLRECLSGLNHVATEPVEHLHNMWNNFFEQSSSSANYFQVCHSGGAIHVRNGLLDYPDSLRQRIFVVAIAPGAYIHKQTCAGVYHYRAEAWRDPVPRIDIFGALRERSTIKDLDSHPDAPFFDHGFSSPTYQEYIHRHILNYLKTQGKSL